MPVPATITPVPITSGIGTSIGAVKDGNNNYYQGVAPYAQITQLLALQTNTTANGNGTVVTVDGLDGSLNLYINNGAGTCTVTLYGSFDNFATLQSWQMVGVALLTSNSAGTANSTNTTRTLAPGVISVVANTSYVYQITDLYPYLMAVISSASGLGAGTYFTGCTIGVYGVPL